MKKYISAILIPCLLLQLCGCMGSYALNEMTIEELKSYDGTNKLNIITNQDDYSICRESSGGSSMDWETTDSSIIIINKKVYLGNNGNIEIPTDSIGIKYSDIQKIEIEKWENYTALEVTGTILVGLAFVGLLILLAADSFKLSDEDVWRAVANAK